MTEVCVVIPALNEEEAIYDLVRLVRRQPDLPLGSEIIVVNNGSTDATAERASAAGARVVHEPRRGYGYACAAGVAAATAHTLVFLDADHSSRPDEIGRLLTPLRQGRADLVLGSRVLGGISRGAMPLHQRFGNWLAATLFRRLYGVTITDLGPYRALARDRLIALHMQEMTFGWPTEMMVKMARNGNRILEVPVSYDPRHSGESKVSGTVQGSLLAGYYILRVMIKYARG